MGLVKLFSSGGSSRESPPPAPNPNPFNFRVTSSSYYVKNDICVAEVVYPDCNTFEGKKILVLRGITLDKLYSLSELDPHFMEGGNLIARFAPTPEGLRLANELARTLGG